LRVNFSIGNDLKRESSSGQPMNKFMGNCEGRPDFRVGTERWKNRIGNPVALWVGIANPDQPGIEG